MAKTEEVLRGNHEQPDCRCVDCGGDQPKHDPTCSYMRGLVGGAYPEEYRPGLKYYGQGIWLIGDGVEDYEAGWYFSDEAEQLHGPFATIEECRDLRRKYVATL